MNYVIKILIFFFFKKEMYECFTIKVYEIGYE